MPSISLNIIIQYFKIYNVLSEFKVTFIASLREIISVVSAPIFSKHLFILLKLSN